MYGSDIVKRINSAGVTLLFVLDKDRVKPFLPHHTNEQKTKQKSVEILFFVRLGVEHTSAPEVRKYSDRSIESERS